MGNRQSDASEQSPNGGSCHGDAQFYHADDDGAANGPNRPPHLTETIDSSQLPHTEESSSVPSSIGVPSDCLRLTQNRNLDDAHKACQLKVIMYPSSADARYRLGVILWKRGTYHESLGYLREAANLYAQRNNNHGIAKSLLMTGRVHHSLGAYKKSKSIFKKGICFLDFETNKGFIVAEDDTKLLLAQILLAMGRTLEATGDWELALGYFQDAIWIQKEVVGVYHVDIASSLLSFGSLLEKAGNFTSALACFEEAYAIYVAVGTDETLVDTGVALANIGWVYYRTGRLEDSLVAYEEALALQRSALGEGHRNTASLWTHIGMVYVRLDRLEDALRSFKDALRLQREVFGDEHEDVALTLCQSATVFERMNMTDESISFVKHALKIQRRLFGQENVLIASTLLQLGGLQMAVGKTRNRSFASTVECVR